MYCQFCGKEIADNSENCIYCGRTLKAEPAQSRMYRHEFTKLKPPTEVKNPKVASLLGFLLGWILLGPVGYIYLGQWNWFWITIVIQVFAYPLTGFIGAYMLLPFVYAFHQYEMAKEVNLMVRKAGPDEDEGKAAESDDVTITGVD
jgi:TM2 domain-containing membrane protein YozV